MPEVPENIEIPSPQQAPVQVKSKPKNNDEPSSKNIIEDFDSDFAPKIIQSRLSPEREQHATQPARLRLESVKKADATVIQVKQPENINYEKVKQNQEKDTKEEAA